MSARSWWCPRGGHAVFCDEPCTCCGFEAVPGGVAVCCMRPGCGGPAVEVADEPSDDDICIAFDDGVARLLLPFDTGELGDGCCADVYAHKTMALGAAWVTVRGRIYSGPYSIGEAVHHVFYEDEVRK